jgi:hypothetical protein
VLRSVRVPEQVLESDFNALDADGNGIIDYSELTMGVPQRHGEERLSILARLQYKFNKVHLPSTPSPVLRLRIVCNFMKAYAGELWRLCETACPRTVRDHRAIRAVQRDSEGTRGGAGRWRSGVGQGAGFGGHDTRNE